MTQNDLERKVDKAYDDGEDLELFIEEYEVIYNGEAMELLSECDSSLMESCALADELGYGLQDINSELLATLLARQIMLDYATEKGLLQ